MKNHKRIIELIILITLVTITIVVAYMSITTFMVTNDKPEPTGINPEYMDLNAFIEYANMNGPEDVSFIGQVHSEDGQTRLDILCFEVNSLDLANEISVFINEYADEYPESVFNRHNHFVVTMLGDLNDELYTAQNSYPYESNHIIELEFESMIVSDDPFVELFEDVNTVRINRGRELSDHQIEVIREMYPNAEIILD